MELLASAGPKLLPTNPRPHRSTKAWKSLAPAVHSECRGAGNSADCRIRSAGRVCNAGRSIVVGVRCSNPSRSNGGIASAAEIVSPDTIE